MIHIRPATPADISAIAQIYSELFFFQEEIHQGETEPFHIHLKNQFIGKMITGRSTTILLAESGTMLLGFIILQRHKTPAQTYLPPYNFSYMIDLAIRQLTQKNIISMKLINAGKEWANTHNSEYIELGL